jgi:hypothetical protein
MSRVFLGQWHPSLVKRDNLPVTLRYQLYSINAIRSHLGASFCLHQIDGHDHVLSYPGLTVW